MGYEVEVGSTLDNRFKILELISRGGMASIYEAIDTASGESVVVKVPFMKCESDPTLFSRFQLEEEIGTKLNHPYIVRLVPMKEKSRPYLVSEFVKGQSLGQKLRNVRPLPIPQALNIASRMCEALDYMHGQGVIHRDLKPDNIMLCDDGSIRILDFGIAKTGGRKLTVAGFSAVLGTPDYMAPEQVKGQRGDARTDVYSLGAILYEMLTGVTPFAGDNPFAIMNARMVCDPPRPRDSRPEISIQIEEIVLHALESDPKKRYQTAAEMQADLEHPDQVTVTGRSLRLGKTSAWVIWWHTFRIPIVSIAGPLVIFLILYLLTRK